MLERGANLAGCDHFPFGIERVRLFPEANGEVVRLGRVEHSPGDLGRFPQRNRQDAAGQRIEHDVIKLVDPKDNVTFERHAFAAGPETIQYVSTEASIAGSSVSTTATLHSGMSMPP